MDFSEGPVVVCVRLNLSAGDVIHFHVVVVFIVSNLIGVSAAVRSVFNSAIRSVCGEGGSWWLRVEEFSSLAMAGYDCDFVGVVKGEMSVNEDLKIRDDCRKREGRREKSPCMWVCIEDYS